MGGEEKQGEITHFVTAPLKAHTQLPAAQPSPAASPGGAGREPAPRRNTTQAGRVCVCVGCWGGGKDLAP